MEDFALAKIDFLDGNYILTKDLKIFDLKRRMFAYETTNFISLDGMNFSYKKVLKKVFSTFKDNPKKYIENKLDDKLCREIVDVWEFHNVEKNYKLTDYIDFTDAKDQKSIDHLYINKKGIYSILSEKYLKYRLDSRKNAIISCGTRTCSIKYFELLEKLNERKVD